METLTCHSNQNAYATAIENNIFVQADAMNLSTKFQLYSQYRFWGVVFHKFRKFSILVAMTTNQIWRFGQNIYLVEDHLTNISKNFRQNICNELQ